MASSGSPTRPSPILVHPPPFIRNPISGGCTLLHHALALLVRPPVPNHHTLHDHLPDQRAQLGIRVRPLRLGAHHDLVDGREQRVGEPLGLPRRVVLGGRAGAERPWCGVEGRVVSGGGVCRLGGCERGKVRCDVGVFFLQVLGWLENRGYQWTERVLKGDLGILLDPRRWRGHAVPRVR